MTSPGNPSPHQKDGWAGRWKKWLHVRSWTCHWVSYTLSLVLLMSFEATLKVSVLLFEIFLIFVGVGCTTPYCKPPIISSFPDRTFVTAHCSVCDMIFVYFVTLAKHTKHEGFREISRFPSVHRYFTDGWPMPFTVLSSGDTEMIGKQLSSLGAQPVVKQSHEMADWTCSDLLSLSRPL